MLPRRSGRIWISSKSNFRVGRLQRPISSYPTARLASPARLGIRPGPRFVGQSLAASRPWRLRPSVAPTSSPGRWSSCPRRERPTAVELEDPLRHVVEIPVVGDGHHGAGYFSGAAPATALSIQVVRRLVEQQQVGLLQQQLAQRDPSSLTTGGPSHRRPVAGISTRPSPARVGHRDPRPGDGRAHSCKVPISANSRS